MRIENQSYDPVTRRRTATVWTNDKWGIRYKTEVSWKVEQAFCCPRASLRPFGVDGLPPVYDTGRGYVLPTSERCWICGRSHTSHSLYIGECVELKTSTR